MKPKFSPTDLWICIFTHKLKHFRKNDYFMNPQLCVQWD